jgi:hypothetical protein
MDMLWAKWGFIERRAGGDKEFEINIAHIVFAVNVQIHEINKRSRPDIWRRVVDCLR